MNYYLQPRVKFSEYTERNGYPVYLRFSYKGEEAWKMLPCYIRDRKDWNDNIKMIVDGTFRQQKNRLIQKFRDEADDRLRQSILIGDGPTIKAFKGLTLDSFEDYINQVDKTSHTQGLLKSLKLFNNDTVPRIDQITVRFLRQLQDYMEAVQDLAQTSVAGYMAVMRKVLNQAVREGYITKSPIGLGLYEPPSPGKTTPIYLIEEEREALLKELLKPKKNLSTATYQVLAYFMFACYTGLRYSDWVRFNYKEQVRDGYMNLRAKKNKSLINRKIKPGSTLEKILAIIQQVGPLKMQYYAVLNQLDTIQETFKLANQLTTHVGRHSFGYLCASLSIEKQVTAYLMGITLKTVEVYYHLTGKHVEAQSKKLEEL